MAAPGLSDMFDREIIDSNVIEAGPDEWAVAREIEDLEDTFDSNNLSKLQKLSFVATCKLAEISEDTASVIEAYLVGTKPFGKHRHKSKSSATGYISYPPNYPVVVDPLCGSRHKVSIGLVHGGWTEADPLFGTMLFAAHIRD